LKIHAVSKVIRVLIIFLFLFPSLCISASSTEECDGQTTIEIEESFFQKYQIADKKLNETYKKFIDVLEHFEKFNRLKPGAIIGVFREAQRAWLTFRDKNCNFYVKLIGEGSLRRTEELGCLVIMTEERTSELSKIDDELIHKGYGEKK